MASTYCTEAQITARVGATRLLALIDRDQDGTADTGVLTDAIESAGALINMRLRQRYGSSVPFADVTDDPATPEEIQRIARDLVLADLYAHYEPDGRDAQAYFARADAALTGLADGVFDVDVARAAAHEGRIVAVYDADTPSFAGLDSDDVPRTRGI